MTSFVVKAGRQTPATINAHPYSASDVQLAITRRGTGFGVPVPLARDQVFKEVVQHFVYAAKFAYECGKRVRT